MDLAVSRSSLRQALMATAGVVDQDLVPNPMPAHNYERALVVVGNPYDYGVPGSKYVVFEGEEVPPPTQPGERSPKLSPEPATTD